MLRLAVLLGVLHLFAVFPFRRETPVSGAVTLPIGTLFFRWSQRLLLDGRVSWRALPPGAVCTTLGLLGPRVLSRLAFSPPIASGAVTYGPFGAFLVIQTWLVAVGVVVFGGALTGRLADEEPSRPTRAGRRRR
ncbi:hypothetical protein [Streptomyces sp. NK15101]|uniref:hypothetical protein n=1 Tax=Streptomyces sp. NK15101 TaxID=2873261 RepID=UPI001CEC93AE|nr:hypothetical protein [Streptomyces sp. NK15101]